MLRSWRKSLPEVFARGVKRSFSHLLLENSRNLRSTVEAQPVLAKVQIMLQIQMTVTLDTTMRAVNFQMMMNMTE